MKPNHQLWARVNQVLLDADNSGEGIVTLLMGAAALVVHAGAAPDEMHARVHLAAILLSPDPGEVGGYRHLLDDELARMRSQKTL